MWVDSFLKGYTITFGYHGMVTFLFVAVLTIIALFFIRHRNGHKLPPGPIGLPFFGYYLFQRKDPIKKMSDLAKRYGNVFGLHMCSQYVVVLNDWEAMTEAYNQPTTLYRPPSLFDAVPYHLGIAGVNGAEWYHTRRLFSRSMKDIGLNKSDWEELVHEEVLDLVRRIEEEGEEPVQVRKVFADSFLSNVVTMLLGHRLPPGHPLIIKLRKGVDAIIDYSPTLGLLNFSHTLSKLLELLRIEDKNLLAEKTIEFANFVSDTVDKNIQNPPSDAEDSFIGRFLEEIQSNKKDKNSYITVDSLKGNVVAMLTGGGETTRSTTIWALIAMADHPEKQRKVHQELDSVVGKDGSIRWKDRFSIPYTLAALFESMRWRTLVPFNTFRFLHMGSQYVVVLNDWEAMTEAYSQPTSLYRPPSLFDGVPYHLGFGGMNGPEWYYGRRLASRAMKDIGLNKSDWEELVHEDVLDLVHLIAEEGEKPIPVRKVFADNFLSNMVTMLLGQRLPPGHPLIKKLMKGVDAIIDYSPTLGLMNFSPTLSKLLELLGIEEKNLLAEKTTEFANFVSDYVDEIIQNPPSDVQDSFVGRFLEEIQSNKEDKNSYMTVDLLKGTVLSLLTGGGETTRSTVIWALIAMAEHPEKQRKVHQELESVIGKDGSIRWKDRFSIPYTLATLFESMRWRTLVPFLTFRMASEDMTVQGYRIPKGTFITANNWLIHNDPRYWENPEQFVPERFLLEDGKVNGAPDSFNPFSYGKRGCPGKLIAEMEGLLYFVMLMQKFKVMPKSGQKVQYDSILGLTYQALNAELRFIPR